MNHDRTEADLEWLAFRYVAGELEPQEAPPLRSGWPKTRARAKRSATPCPWASGWPARPRPRHWVGVLAGLAAGIAAAVTLWVFAGRNPDPPRARITVARSAAGPQLDPEAWVELRVRGRLGRAARTRAIGAGRRRPGRPRT